jgi:futalosine hydrolase
MQILLCAATPFEIQPTLDFLVKAQRTDEVECLITGVGLLATTYALTKAMVGKKPGIIIQAGIAGAFHTDLSLAQCVVVDRESLGDTGVMEAGRFQSLFTMGLLSANQHPWKDTWLPNPHMELLLSTGLPALPATTIAEISTNPESIHYLKNGLGAALESMEGAALHYIALQEGIPFLQLRSISNYVGERDKENWRLKESIESLNTHLQRILLKLLNT